MNAHIHRPDHPSGTLSVCGRCGRSIRLVPGTESRRDYWRLVGRSTATDGVRSAAAALVAAIDDWPYTNAAIGQAAEALRDALEAERAATRERVRALRA